MSEQIDTRTGEVVETALVKTGGMRDIVKAQDIPLLDVMETMDSLDWRNLKPHQTALLLMQKPFSVPGGGTLFLNFRQAILFATRCFELNVSPFSSEVWFNTSTASVNLTLEGRKQVARNKGIDLGPPQFEELSRPWPSNMSNNAKIDELKKLGFDKDLGVKCKMRVGPIANAEHAEYTAYLSEWMVTKSIVWKERPTHMLQIRSAEKCISMAMGTGISDNIVDE